MTDSLKVYDILKDAQIPDSQARAITQAIRESDAAVVLDIRAVLTERFDLVDKRFDLMDQKFDLLERRMDERFAQVYDRMDRLTDWANERFATKTDLANLKAELMRWMFTFWVGQLAATVAIVKLWR